MWLLPDIKNRFLAGLNRCGVSQGEGNCIGVAVSGGPDSLALLLLMHECFAGQLYAATVDHQLREEAAKEARFVGAICSERSIPHTILKPVTPITGSIQSSARFARYELLDKWADDNGCTQIATAHHADDQLETILMRLARGSGVDGLSGVRSVNGRVIRPLLFFTKLELVEVCKAADITPVQDPSNKDMDFDRVRMRDWLSSTLHPFNPVAAARSASALSDASIALDWMTQQLAKKRVLQGSGQIAVDPSNLPRELQRRLLLYSLALFEPETSHKGVSIERGLNALNAGQTFTLGNTLCKGGAAWHFSPAPPRSSS